MRRLKAELHGARWHAVGGSMQEAALKRASRPRPFSASHLRMTEVGNAEPDTSRRNRPPEGATRPSAPAPIGTLDPNWQEFHAGSPPAGEPVARGQRSGQAPSFAHPRLMKSAKGSPARPLAANHQRCSAAWRIVAEADNRALATDGHVELRL